MSATLLLGDCRTLLAEMEPNSVDAVVCDPPYELGFMGKAWDRSGVAFDPETWAAVLRVAKPGAHLIAFGGTRTMHRIACAIEDAGWTIRDQIHWAQWQGFPKSQDVSAAIDALHGAEREVVGRGQSGRTAIGGDGLRALSGTDGTLGHDITAPATDDAKRWAGWGTGLKPAVEFAILARKPLSESSVARNVLRWGTGALNLDACRFAPGDSMWPGGDDEATMRAKNPGRADLVTSEVYGAGRPQQRLNPIGRFPANLVHVPKASRAERELGCEGLPVRAGFEAVEREEGSAGLTPAAGAGRTAAGVRNHHATVKPLRLMRWLVRLVTPPSGLVLDPFMGSGTTGMAAVGQGFRFVGCELDADHMQIARARVEYASSGGVDCDLEDIREPSAQVSLFGG